MSVESFVWDYREGQDRHGDKDLRWILIHGSGRVVASVLCPVTDGEFFYTTVFYLAKSMDEEDYRFVDVDSAKSVILGLVLNYYLKQVVAQ